MRSFNAKGVTSAYITSDTSSEMAKGVVEEKYRLVFITPELLIGSHKWRKVISSETYEKHLKVFIIDEAHCIKKW